MNACVCVSCCAVQRRQAVLNLVSHRKASSYREVHYHDLWSETAFVSAPWPGDPPEHTAGGGETQQRSTQTSTAAVTLTWSAVHHPTCWKNK